MPTIFNIIAETRENLEHIFFPSIQEEFPYVVILGTLVPIPIPMIWGLEWAAPKADRNPKFGNVLNPTHGYDMGHQKRRIGTFSHPIWNDHVYNGNPWVFSQAGESMARKKPMNPSPNPYRMQPMKMLWR